MLFFFPFHLPSSPFLPHCLLLLCSTRYCCCCCCCSLLLHPFQHTPVDAAAPCCTRSNILHCCYCCFNHHFGFQLRGSSSSNSNPPFFSAAQELLGSFFFFICGEMGVWNKLRNYAGVKQNLTVDGAEAKGKKEGGKSEERIAKKKGDKDHVGVTVTDDSSASSNVEHTTYPFKEESNFINDLKEPQKKALKDFKEKIKALIEDNGFAIPPEVLLESRAAAAAEALKEAAESEAIKAAAEAEAIKAAAEAEAIKAAEEPTPPTAEDAKSAVNDASATTIESTEALDEGAGTAVPAESETLEVETVTAGAPVVDALEEMIPAPEVAAVVDTTPAPEVGSPAEATPALEVQSPVETAPAPEAQVAVETTSAPEAQVSMETAPAPEDQATADVEMPEVETKEAVLETKIAELKETTKEEVATETLEEETVENTMPLEESKENPEDVCLWGVPLLDTKGDERTNVILLKFLRAKDFKVDEACAMLVKTVKWRQSFLATTIREKKLQSNLDECFYMQGKDKEGHPVCYNIWGAFHDNPDLFEKMLGNDSKMKNNFLRWRVRLLEKGIKELEFTPGGTSAILQVNDLKNIPLLKKEMRDAVHNVIDLLKDNYPELMVKNVFLNPPWYFSALYNLINPFITPRMKSKIFLARPGQIFNSIAPEDVPVQYGGFARSNDAEFTGAESSVKNLTINAGKKESIEIALEKAGSTAVWDLSVIGWDVSYGAEFAPTATELHHTIPEKTKKLVSVEQTIRGTFNCQEPGKLLLCINNNSASKREKRVLYRFKVKVPDAVVVEH